VAGSTKNSRGDALDSFYSDSGEARDTWGVKTVKTFTLKLIISMSNKCCSFEYSFHQVIHLKKSEFPQIYETPQLFLTLILMRNVS